MINLQPLFINQAGEFTNSSGLSQELSQSVGVFNHNIIWLESDHITLLEASMPTRKPSSIEQGLPYVVEEMVLSEIEDMHCAWNDVPKNQLLPVAVVAKKIMDVCKQSMIQNNLRSSKLVPDIFMVPWFADSWTLLILEHRSILRTGEYQGISGSHEFIADYLANKGDIEVKNISMPGIKLADIWNKRQLISKEQADDKLAQQYHSHQLINLLQGQYALSFALFRKSKDMLFPALAALVVACLFIVGKTVDYIDLLAQKEQLDSLIVIQAQQIFPDFRSGNAVKPVVAAHLQKLNKGLQEKQASSWIMLEQSVPILSSCTNCVFEKIDFIDGGFSFRVSSFDQLTNLEQKIKGLNGYDVETELDTKTNDQNEFHTLNANIQKKG